MKTYKLKTEPIATTQSVWMGIDVHKVSLHITILDEEGEQVWAGSVPHGREHVAGLVRRLETTQITAVYEAGPTGYKLKHWLEELGCEAFICPRTYPSAREESELRRTHVIATTSPSRHVPECSRRFTIWAKRTTTSAKCFEHGVSWSSIASS